jgi:hypothetical protein
MMLNRWKQIFMTQGVEGLLEARRGKGSTRGVY